ncbi:MAG: ABC transporter ATP-binding protein [Candidatus Lokiarchaeota archaeon]|nr:ABC transporter ATP-binding protein [Candidatus Lokiarchaeota archaeon]
MVFSGLDAEEYDRQYKDKVLFNRISTYFKKYRKKMILIIILLVISSISSSFLPILTSIAIQNLEITPNLIYLTFIVVLMLCINLSAYVINYFQQINSAKVIGNVIMDIRIDANAAVLNHDLSFFDKNPIGKIVSRVNRDSDEFGTAVDLTIQAIANLFSVVFLISYMFFISVFLTLLFLIAIPIFFLIALVFRRVARKKTLLGQRALASVNSYVKESFSGIQIAKTFRQEEKLYNNFNKVNKQSYGVNLRRAFVLNAIFPSLGVVQGIILMLFVYFGGSLVLSSGLNSGQLLLFIQSTWFLSFPLFSIASFWPQFQTGLSAGERIFALIDTQSKIIQIDNIIPNRLKGSIEFKNLTFEYEADKSVFKDFSLKIDPGESIAIVGHTGAGKSSLASLIARFYEFQGGDILIDGISIRKYDIPEYRKQIGIIPQTPFLWADTLENNITYCCKEASRESVIDALEQAGGADWVEDLSNGLNTYIRERGSLLSMGQRQLAVFARVLLEDPSILILDEATASIDPFTETKIQDALEKTIKNRTSIIIAHRLWTVRHVDKIVVLDHGKIVEEGNHDQLMEKNGKYSELYNTYFRHQSLEYVNKVYK